MAFTTTITRADDPLLSWNDGPAKKSIIAFVEKVTKPGSPDFVHVAERIATFDNDGTLWCEKPLAVLATPPRRPTAGLLKSRETCGCPPCRAGDQRTAQKCRPQLGQY